MLTNISTKDITNDLEEWVNQIYVDVKEAFRRLHAESEITDKLIKHLHSENAELRQENEQLQIEISILKEENKFISQYLCTPQLGVIKNA